ncbi:Stk1 family PASTA domain-containing Ser/Thr kinase [Microlunatus soli]|uniref:non-specific serine/threonine protein kinase n=1 Tax=Microlunatus soli TaxID=630515 RepID=A0A1H1PKF1_9ACTN|nr:Stk1 family PASTA domain-containing Ser/Thr kinase [Microlunatus soli]SDS11570.1 serine/threonine protein kinase [Microlunatus soli]
MTSTSDPLVGHVLDGRYQVLDRVARGGMATVYRATDTRLGRMVAVKVMHVGLGDDADFARKFDREARSAARLSHPHVVSVFDQGDDAGRPYIVMELVEGRTLRSVISRESPLTPIRALTMIEPVLSALAAAHEAGLVHRDIKPENVLISERGEIKVGDFGLARAVTAQTSTATAGLLIGTVSYLPPELVVSGKADARSDVYSTGVVLFELLTGRKPHTGETPIQVAYAHVHNDVPAPSTFQTAGPIPDYVDALIARATARDADARPHDAKILLAQVRRVRSALQAGLRSDPELSQDLTVPLLALRQQRARDAADEVDPYASTTAIGPALEAAALQERAEFAAQPQQPRAEQIRAEQIRPAVDPTPAAYAEDEQEFTPTDIRFLSGPSTPAHLSSPSTEDSASSQLSPIDVDDDRDVRRRRPNQPVHRPRHRFRGWIVLILVLLLTAVAAAAGWYLAKGRFTSAPALTSMPQAQAKIIAREAGLQIAFAKDYSETVPKGNVINTSPQPGGKILRGGEIDATVSRGPERYPMPTVAGLTEDSAVAALDRQHLRSGTVHTDYSESVDKGLVIKASETPGDQLKPDSRIDLVISAGPRPITITDYTGRPADQAAAALKDAGFTVKIKNKHSATVPPGAVIKQSPDDGEGHKDDRVTLVTSLGPVMVTVPTVKSMGVEAAKKTLEDKGFTVRTNKSGVLFLGLGYVAASDPAGGTKAPKGSTITLSLV